MQKTDDLVRMIRQSTGKEKAEKAIRNVKIFHMTDGSMEEGDILIYKNRIIGAGSCCRAIPAQEEFDGKNLYALPGLIDTHVHIESSLLTPMEYEKLLLQHGVTTSVCDPHELSNVVGTAAWDYFIDCAENMLTDLVIRLSSCVPATSMETAGAEISSKDICAYLGKKHVAGLGEMMNVPGVLFCEEEIMKKMASASPIDGHSPLLSGNDLNGYLAAGAKNCHECSLLEEAKEKLRRGMNILIREGSVAKNLDTLMPLISLQNAPFLAFCTDDRNPVEIKENGHLDGMIARCIEKGYDIFTVYRIATLSAANIASLPDRGVIAPGKRADIILVSDLEKCKVEHTFSGGILADEKALAARKKVAVPEKFLHSIKRRKIKEEDLLIRKEEWKGDVIGIVEGDLISKKLSLPLSEKDGLLLPDPQRDIQKLFVFERHGKNGNIGKGFVHGFGMKESAIASSIGHDCHNICAAGTNDRDIAVAVNALLDCGGGMAVAKEGRILGLLPLPVGGLMTEKSYEEVIKDMEKLQESIRETCCKSASPFMRLAFLVLPVIPEIKLTDRGLVDVENFKFY